MRLDGDFVASQFADDLSTIAPSAQGRRGLLPGYMVLNAALRADPDRSAAILDRIPASRWGTPDDLKGAVVFRSDDSDCAAAEE